VGGVDGKGSFRDAEEVDRDHECVISGIRRLFAKERRAYSEGRGADRVNRHDEPTGDRWITVTGVVEDPAAAAWSQ
jgi:hypothetical protein